jgi:hypothetical protein
LPWRKSEYSQIISIELADISLEYKDRVVYDQIKEILSFDTEAVQPSKQPLTTHFNVIYHYIDDGEE